MKSSKLQVRNDMLFLEENQKAEAYIEAGDLAAAARILVNIIEQDNENWRAYNNMGIISWEKKAWDDSFTTFKYACDLKHDYVDALVNLFDVSLKLKRVDQVLTYFKRAFAQLPNNKELEAIVSNIEEQGDDIYLSERASRIGFYNPRIDEAKQLLEDGQLNLAMEKFLEINDDEGPNAEVYCGLGVISYYHKHYKDAFSLFYESIKLNPTDPDTFLNLIDAAKDCGLVEDAKKIFELHCAEIPSLRQIASDFEKIAQSESK